MTKSTLAQLGTLLFAAIAPQYEVMPLAIGAYFSALFLLYFANLRFEILKARSLLVLVLMGAGIWLVFQQYHTLFGYEAGVTLLALLLALKMLESRRERDLYVVVILGLFFIVTRFLLQQSMYWALYSLVVVGGFLALLVNFNQSQNADKRGAVEYAGALMVQAVPLSILLFLLFPRLDAPLWDLQLSGQSGLTGLSDSMAPGSINELIRSEAPAFRAEFIGSEPAKNQLYWRGPIFWRYDGYRWDEGSPYDAGSLPMPPSGLGSKLEYRLVLEPHGNKWILALDLPASHPAGSTLTADYRVVAKEPVFQKQSYRLSSYLEYNTGALSDAERRAALQIPKGVSERTKALANDWRRASANAEGVVRSALAFFNREPFIYTLSPPQRPGNATDGFLFETRAGFCEHYASAFTLLMRLAGVPSRVVTGYLGGEFNELGKYFLVRQYDAHAWSEVWIQSRGWVRIDPTAAVAPERVQSEIDLTRFGSALPVSFKLVESGILNQLGRSIRLSLDALNTKWHIWILGYDKQRQRNLLEMVGLKDFDQMDTVVLMILIGGALVAMLTALLLYRRKPGEEPAVKAYNDFCRKLEQVGIFRKPNEGPVDFLRRIKKMRAELGYSAEEIIDLYCSVRFGKGADPDAVVLLQDKVQALAVRKRLRRSRR